MNKKFWKACLTRALRTFCQTALAVIGTCSLLEEVDWFMVASASAMAGIICILTAITTGLPEAENQEE